MNMNFLKISGVAIKRLEAKHRRYLALLLVSMVLVVTIEAGTLSLIAMYAAAVSDPDNYMFVEKTQGFRISLKHKIHELYPYCHLSVSFLCSTNLMAPMFKKHLIIYDFFGMTTEDSERAREFRIPGASYAYSPEELYKVICEHFASQGARSGEREVDRAAIPACEKIYRHITEAFA
jgi:hypothetical protein